MLRKVTPENLELLRKLQNYPHRKITEFDIRELNAQYFINLLVDYLNFHTETNITVKSLSLLI